MHCLLEDCSLCSICDPVALHHDAAWIVFEPQHFWLVGEFASEARHFWLIREIATYWGQLALITHLYKQITSQNHRELCLYSLSNNKEITYRSILYVPFI